jgi:hypothetical protein
MIGAPQVRQVSVIAGLLRLCLGSRLTGATIHVEQRRRHLAPHNHGLGLEAPLRRGRNQIATLVGRDGHNRSVRDAASDAE